MSYSLLNRYQDWTKDSICLVTHIQRILLFKFSAM
nr:MAG TPA: hypothetical protein [Caudoviricetes sp.]